MTATTRTIRQGPNRCPVGSFSGSALGNIQKFASGVGIIEHFSGELIPEVVASDAADRRHWLANIQRRVLYGMTGAGAFKSLKKCSSMPVPAQVRTKSGEIVRTGAPGRCEFHDFRGAVVSDGAGDKGKTPPPRFGYAGVQRCGNALNCFICAPKVRYKRREEVKKALRVMMGSGHTFLFITFTAPHNLATDPRVQIRAFNEALRFLKSGRAFQDFKERWGYSAEIKAVEMTLDHPLARVKRGCHYHSHHISFFQRGAFSDEEVSEIQDFLSERWQKALERNGIEINDLEAFKRHGVIIEVPRLPEKQFDDGVCLPERTLKQLEDDGDLDRLADYVADGSSCEMAPALFSKQGFMEQMNKDGGIWKVGHFQFYALALTRYPSLRPQMLKVMQAFAGVSWMQWTKGLKAFCGIEEKTDQEAVVENNGKPVYAFSDREWHEIDRQKLQRRVVRAVEASIDGEKKQADDFGDKYVESDGRAEVVSSVALIMRGIDPLTWEELPKRLDDFP